VPQAISDRYELLEELSHGGMGDVWRGYDAVLDRGMSP
jgi:serine/threonine protein kinase